jgi:outer membrane protein OmpA-like peptidoglycan-associated protein
MLDKVAKFLIERDEDYFIKVTGHTDSKSSQSYNLALSERRAKAVRAYMVAAGVDADKLQFEGLSFSKNAAPEKDRVDMARNRRVELELSVENRNIRFISQVEDLQVNPRIRGIRSWDYVFIAEHNAVPSGLNLGAGSSLNRVHEYLVKRVSLPMKEYQNLTVQVNAPSLEIGNRVKAILYGEGIAQDRIIVSQVSGSEVEFDYSDDSFLRIYDQRDDINLINNSLALRMMDNLMNILRQREDLLLIRDFSQSYTVPNMVTFAGSSTQLSNEVQAILSRIGSYLKNSVSVRIAISGDGSRASSSRLKAMKDYLVEWGIDANRIEISNESTAEVNQVNIKYLNADSINLLELDLINDGKGGGK